MKYKVIIDHNSSPNFNNGVSFSFYTRASAAECCEQWRQQNANSYAYLWDGSTWTYYAPVP